MKKGAERLQEYYETLQPSEEFQDRLLSLEPPKPPEKKKTRGAWRFILAAAACLVVGLIGWRMLKPEQGNPNLALPGESAAQTAPATAAPSERASTDASEPDSAPTRDSASTEHAEPTEQEEPTQPSEPSETDARPAAPQPVEPPTEPSAAPPTVPDVPNAAPNGPTEPPAAHAGTRPTEPTEAPPQDTTPTAPPTQTPTEPIPPETDAEPTDGILSELSEESYEGWIRRQGGREYLVLHALVADETAVFDVTGKLDGGDYETTVEAFGVTLQVRVERIGTASGQAVYNVEVNELP